MKDLRPIFLYALSLVGLVLLTILFTGLEDLIEAEPLLPPANPTARTWPATAPATQANTQACSTPSQEMTLGYIPNKATTINLNGERLTIFGTVYASDYMTPLPGALVEVWWVNPDSETQPHSPFIWDQAETDAPSSPSSTHPEITTSFLWGQAKTDATGHYEINILKHHQAVLVTIHYRVIYRGDCLLSMEIDLARHTALYQLDAAESILQGPVDIVLPILPPPSSD